MNKKIHKKSSKLKNFLNIKELVQKTNIPKIIKANPINSAKKSINKFYQDYKKIKEREKLKKEKKIELVITNFKPIKKQMSLFDDKEVS